MDFRRIEVIFLIVFFSLDIFLLVSFRNSQQVVSSGSTTTSTVTEMRKRDISFGKLDSKSGAAYYLGSRPNNDLAEHLNKLKNQELQYDDDDHKLESSLTEPFSVNTTNQESKLNSFLKKESNVLYGTKYKYAPQLSTASQIVYAQTDSVGELYDKTGRVTFEVDNKKVVGYTQTYVDDLMILHEKEVTKSEKDVISNLYTNSEIPNNSRIVYANLAYTKLTEAKGSTIYIPVWFVTIQNKDSKVDTLKKVNAFTGNIIKATTAGTITGDSDDSE
ncbi:two-component system regulatory protein YycI [Companilactobacillus hulinensis]|uniref:two-component system regulatory protein YycI n=1 Tax=Companilactobacillus hulinensis TaxID=2486007 RepID=UPI000F767C73|nr:two-component system regulatory protein YycI [Companilactobacillus hulinensis]